MIYRPRVKYLCLSVKKCICSYDISPGSGVTVGEQHHREIKQPRGIEGDYFSYIMDDKQLKKESIQLVHI